MDKLKLVLVGTPDFGLPSFEKLSFDDRFAIQLVVTAPDKPAGRGQKLAKSAVAKWAETKKLPLSQPQKIETLAPQLKELEPDFIVVAAYGQILRADILAIPKFGAINIHGSLLPKYRGSACVAAAILNKEKFTGATIMLMDKGLDTGPILCQKKIPILASDTAGDLCGKISLAGADIISQTLIDFKEGRIPLQPQDKTVKSMICKLNKSDGRINWGKSALEIDALIRAMSPWPGAYTFIADGHQQKQALKIRKACPDMTDSDSLATGRIYARNGRLFVQCGQGRLELVKIQLEGKRPISGHDFISGYGKYLDSILG